MTSTCLCRDAQVVRRHQIGEHVVANEGRVLVGAGDAVEMPDPVPVVMAQRRPQPRGFHQHRETAVGLERIIAGDNAIPLECHGDVGVDMPGRCACWPIPRAFLPSDRPPGKSGPRQIEFGGAVTRQVQR